MNLRFRRAEPADAAALADFAARTFAETFGPDNRAADMEAHLAAAYGVAQQARELADPESITLVFEGDSGLAAFAQVRRHAPPSSGTVEATVELQRFYVDSPWHGRGLAQRLMTSVKESANELGGGKLWLTVWERNARAIAFYGKCGFYDVGATDFFVGTDRQTDRVMVVELGQIALHSFQ
ncbi:MAG: GNAT family N-acetyltransferase [Gemmatimonadaceae bacterium]|nr:GNAT family N-acetyltransferase [Gemmatimonadaceae bacterium]MDQ3516969.1 GNAT family N-acetyltransferase [Gemmatimonadota bacterium]